MSEQKSIAIIGGGLSGLVAAWELCQQSPSTRITLFESSSRLGGVLNTEQIGGYLVEQSADMFTTEPPAALDFCQRLGKADELISTLPIAQRAFIATPTGLCPVPNGFSLMLPSDLEAVVGSELLDAAGQSRFLAERTVPKRRDDTDENLQSFAVRRFGQQVFDRLIQPLVSGIYTADPRRLSMRAALSRFVELEKKYGSLIAAAEAQRNQLDHRSDLLDHSDQTASGARYDLFRAPRLGMGQLIAWIVKDLSAVEIHTDSVVNNLARTDQGWRLQWSAARPSAVKLSPQHSQYFDGVIVASSANSAAKLCRDVDASLVGELTKFEAASCAVVVLGFERKQLQRPFDGYGIVVPSYLNRKLIAASFSSNKFANRAPRDRVLIRCFVGGALQADLVEQADEQLLRISLDELDSWCQINGTPELSRIYRWRETMPQYHVGHQERVARIKLAIEQQPGLELTGNSYNGVGIPVCVAESRLAAQRMNRFLEST